MPTLASRETDRPHRTASSTEADLLDQFARGPSIACDSAFEALFRAHQAEVFRWILRIVRDAPAAEDLTIETFWRIYQARTRFHPDREFAPWARTIGTRAAFDWLRSQRSHAALDVELPPDVPARGRTDSAITVEIRQRTAQAFARLRPGLRIAATLALLEDQPYADVARALGISVAAVKLRVFRALRQLRADLTRQGITP